MAMDAQKELQKDLEKLRKDNLDKIKADNDEWTKKRLEQMEIDKKALIESAKGEISSIAMLAVEKLVKNNKHKRRSRQKAKNSEKNITNK